MLYSYWDILPIEIQDIIYNFKKEILEKERQELINSLTTDELVDQLGYKLTLDFNGSGHNMIKINKNNKIKIKQT